MRIELNSGGLSGLVAIAEFELSVDALDIGIDQMISSFQAVKKAIYNLNGGVGKLDDAVDSLGDRIFTEENKKHNLADLENRFGDFLSIAISMDKAAAKKVTQNRDEFYRLNEHLRPVIEFGDEGWNPFRAAGELLGNVGEFIIETIVEYADEVLTITITAVAIVGGLALVFITGGLAGFVIGGALIGGGVGMAIAGYKSFRDDGDVDLLEAFAGFGLGAIAGAVTGATLYGAGYLASAYKGLGGFLGSQALQGAGTSVAGEFFKQTIIEGESVGFDNLDFAKMLYEGTKGAITSMAVGYLFKFSGLSDFIGNKTGDFLGKYIKNNYQLVKVLSGTPANMFEGAAECVVARGVDVITGNDDQPFTASEFFINVGLNVLFGMAGDYANMDGGVGYNEYPITQDDLYKILKSRNLSDADIKMYIDSFNSDSWDVTIKNTRPAGETRWLYGSGHPNHPASGIFTTEDFYFDNASGIAGLATPTTNSMLVADKVTVHGTLIEGTVGPQPGLTLDAMVDGTDSVVRIGGGRQTISDGGLRSGAVKFTGERRRMHDSARRLKLLGPGLAT